MYSSVPDGKKTMDFEYDLAQGIYNTAPSIGNNIKLELKQMKQVKPIKVDKYNPLRVLVLESVLCYKMLHPLFLEVFVIIQLYEAHLSLAALHAGVCVCVWSLVCLQREV